jgi:hypothetical protein
MAPAKGQCMILNIAPIITTAAPNPYSFAMNFFHALLPGFIIVLAFYLVLHCLIATQNYLASSA